MHNYVALIYGVGGAALIWMCVYYMFLDVYSAGCGVQTPPSPTHTHHRELAYQHDWACSGTITIGQYPMCL